MEMDVDAFVSPTLDDQTRACLRIWASVMSVGIADTVRAWKAGERFPWFESDVHYPGSFVWLCELFDMDPAQVRSTTRMKAREIERAARTTVPKEAEDEKPTRRSTRKPA